VHQLHPVPRTYQNHRVASKELVMKKLFTLTVGFALLIGLALPAGATEGEEEDNPDPGEYTYVELVEVPEGWEEEGEPPDDDGEEYEDDGGGCGGPASEASASAVCAPPSRSDVIATWSDINKREILLRRAEWEKIRNKHGLTVRTVTRATQVIERQRETPNGTTYRYEAFARQWTCRTFPWPECWVSKEQMVKVVVDFRTDTPDRRQRGVITAYCPQQPRRDLCPSWVNDHLN